MTVGFSIEKLGRSRSNRESEEGVNAGESMEWVKVSLTAVPGVSMDDVGVDQEPVRKKEHRRIPSTIAIEEVKVGHLSFESMFPCPLWVWGDREVFVSAHVCAITYLDKCLIHDLS